MRFDSTRIRGLLAALALPLLLGACDGLLDVENPAVMEEKDLDDPELVDFLTYGVVGEFQEMYTAEAYWTAIFTDELANGHTYRPYPLLDQRELSPADEHVNYMYADHHKARATADQISERIRGLLGDTASTSLKLARTLTYAGYSFVVLGERFCAVPIDGGEPMEPAAALDSAVARFDEAIQIAEAARQAGKNAASADSLINLARVGAARALLQAGRKDEAVSYAQQVPEDFVFWIPHSDNSSVQWNYFYNAFSTYSPDGGEARWAGIDPAFAGLNDARIPQTDTVFDVMDNRAFYLPYQPSSFSGWTGQEGVEFTKTAALRLASGLEARYIIQEAQGPTLEFINERRAVGGQPALTQAELDTIGAMAELRDQRRRDFYLDGHRLGDLRRYLNQYGVDQFPSGPVPQTDNDVYGTATCLPVASDETNSNLGG